MFTCTGFLKAFLLGRVCYINNWFLVFKFQTLEDADATRNVTKVRSVVSCVWVCRRVGVWSFPDVSLQPDSALDVDGLSSDAVSCLRGTYFWATPVRKPKSFYKICKIAFKPPLMMMIKMMIIIIMYCYYLLQLNFHSLVQIKQTINIHKRNNTETQYKQHKTQ